VSLQSSQLGKFTFQKEVTNVTKEEGASVRREQWRVIFSLNDSFARNFDAKFLNASCDHSIPVVEANYFIIAQRCAVLKETVILAIKMIVDRLGEVIQTGKKVSIEFDGLGVLKSDRKICEFVFHKQWDEPMEMKYSAGRQVPSRRKTVPRKHASAKETREPRKPSRDEEDIVVLDVDESSIATLSEVGEIGHNHPGLRQRGQPQAAKIVKDRQKGHSESPHQYIPTPPTSKRPQSSSGTRRFTTNHHSQKEKEKRMALPVSSATVVVEEDFPKARKDEKRRKRTTKKKRSKSRPQGAEAKKDASTDVVGAEHVVDDAASIAASDAFSSVSNPTKDTIRPNTSHHITESRKYSFPNLRQAGPPSTIQMLRKMSANPSQTSHMVGHTPLKHFHSPAGSAFRDSLSNTQESHVEAITKHIDSTPYRARKAPDAALNSAMMEAFQRYETQIRQQFEEQEREEWERLRKIERNEKTALQAIIEKRMKNKSVQDFLRKQILFSQKVRLSDGENSRKTASDDFNNRIGVSTGAVMRAEKQKAHLLKESLEKQLADKRRREQMIQKYDKDQEFKLIENDQENYKKEREYLARRKKQTQQMLQKSWDHQVMIRMMQEESTNESFRRSMSASRRSEASTRTVGSSWSGMGKVLY